MSKKIIIVLACLFGIIGIFAITNSNQPKSDVIMSKIVETPDKKSDGSFVSNLAEFKVIEEKDKFTIIYPRNKFKEEDLLKELEKVVAKTDMQKPDQGNLYMEVGANNALGLKDTKTDCGFKAPSSNWCYQIKNIDSAKSVQLIIQKGKFTI